MDIFFKICRKEDLNVTQVARKNMRVHFNFSNFFL